MQGNREQLAIDAVLPCTRAPAAAACTLLNRSGGRITRPAFRENDMEQDIICFSHLRWDFVWQRPQHLMTQAAMTRRVWFVEEPQESAGDVRLEIRPVSQNITVVVPVVRPEMNRPQRLRAQAHLLTDFFRDRVSGSPV